MRTAIWLDWGAAKTRIGGAELARQSTAGSIAARAGEGCKLRGMRTARRSTGAGVATGAILVLTLWTTPAVADTAENRELVAKTSLTCEFVRSTVGHPLAVDDGARSENVTASAADNPCDQILRYVFEHATRTDLFWWNGTTWVGCGTSGWLYQTNAAITRTHKTWSSGNMPCGAGYYGAYAYGYFREYSSSSYIGGSVWSGSHYFS